MSRSGASSGGAGHLPPRRHRGRRAHAPPHERAAAARRLLRPRRQRHHLPLGDLLRYAREIISYRRINLPPPAGCSSSSSMLHTAGSCKTDTRDAANNAGCRALGFNMIMSFFIAVVVNGAMSYATLPVSTAPTHVSGWGNLSMVLAGAVKCMYCVGDKKMLTF